eukprot:scaffold74669_cov40-Phaeocystis_antarctica.AAC.1
MIRARLRAHPPILLTGCRARSLACTTRNHARAVAPVHCALSTRGGHCGRRRARAACASWLILGSCGGDGGGA